MEMDMPELRPMYMSDLVKVVKIIDAHDDDDAESAQNDYQETGIEHQFVLEVDSKIVGVTGFREVDATDKTYWLSWTYLDESYRGKGLGKNMVTQIISKLQAEDGRKLFVKLSNYKDPELGNIYEQAYQMYLSVGFQEEVISKDFYDVDEDQLIMGLNLRKDEENEDQEEDLMIQDEKPVIRFNGLHEIEETEGAYTFHWVVKDSKKLFGKRSFSVEDLNIGLRAVKEQGGRKVFLTFPSNLPLIHVPLQSAGFKFVGELSDYYEEGVHELHFTHDLVHIQPK